MNDTSWSAERKECFKIINELPDRALPELKQTINNIVKTYTDNQINMQSPKVVHSTKCPYDGVSIDQICKMGWVRANNCSFRLISDRFTGWTLYVLDDIYGEYRIVYSIRHDVDVDIKRDIYNKTGWIIR